MNIERNYDSRRPTVPETMSFPARALFYTCVMLATLGLMVSIICGYIAAITPYYGEGVNWSNVSGMGLAQLFAFGLLAAVVYFIHWRDN